MRYLPYIRNGRVRQRFVPEASKEPRDDTTYKLLLVAFSICSSRAVLAPEDHQLIILTGSLEYALLVFGVKLDRLEMGTISPCRWWRREGISGGWVVVSITSRMASSTGLPSSFSDR